MVQIVKRLKHELADIATEYYGDYSVERLGEMLERMTIKKGKQ